MTLSPAPIAVAPFSAASLDRSIAKAASGSRAATVMAPWRLRKVTSHIEEHLEDRIRLSELADLAGLSSSHLSRTFKVTQGLTLHAFIRRRRIERAKILMAQPDLCLAIIAQSCGFADQAHFTRQFRDMVGISPSRWRRALRASSAA